MAHMGPTPLPGWSPHDRNSRSSPARLSAASPHFAHPGPGLANFVASLARGFYGDMGFINKTCLGVPVIRIIIYWGLY